MVETLLLLHVFHGKFHCVYCIITEGISLIPRPFLSPTDIALFLSDNIALFLSFRSSRFYDVMTMSGGRGLIGLPHQEVLAAHVCLQTRG